MLFLPFCCHNYVNYSCDDGFLSQLFSTVLSFDLICSLFTILRGGKPLRDPIEKYIKILKSPYKKMP